MRNYPDSEAITLTCQECTRSFTARFTQSLKRYCSDWCQKKANQRFAQERLVREAQEQAAKIASLHQDAANRIAAAYRRGFEDGWRESKLEVIS